MGLFRAGLRHLYEPLALMSGRWPRRRLLMYAPDHEILHAARRFARRRYLPGQLSRLTRHDGISIEPPMSKFRDVSIIAIRDDDITIEPRNAPSISFALPDASMAGQSFNYASCRTPPTLSMMASVTILTAYSRRALSPIPRRDIYAATAFQYVSHRLRASRMFYRRRIG